MNQSKLQFNKQFINDFWELFKPYWISEEKWSAWFFLALNIMCMLANLWASVGLNRFNKDFYDALQQFDQPALMIALMHFVFYVAMFVLAACYAFYFNGLLAARWRRWLTQHYLKDWLSHHRYYRMQLLNKQVDNPDQRISEDLDMFPTLTLTLFFIVLQAFLTLICYGVILWGVSDRLIFSIGKVHFTIPNYIFLGAMFYGVFGVLMTNWIGKKLVHLDYQQQYYNADFRYAMVRLREASEQVALYRGESLEQERFTNLFKRVFKNFMDSLRLKKHLMFFTNAYNNVAFVLGIFMAVPLFLQKKIQLGGMMQISAAGASVANAFSMLVNMYQPFAEWQAVILRLSEFRKNLSSVNFAHSSIHIQEHEAEDILIDHLTLTVPYGRTLLENVSFIIPGGNYLLLSGPSGCGKSTLLRAMAGLWYFGAGKIFIPKNKKVMFVPQKTYLPLGSLNDILFYPHSHFDEEKIQAVLQDCHLTKFANQLSEVKNWSHELSVGEQQLIAFARIFLTKPDIVFLDEATSALDEASEQEMYHHLANTIPHATVVSIGHRASLKQFHDSVIQFPFLDTTYYPFIGVSNLGLKKPDVA